MPKIFLTGGRGNVGRYALKELLRRGYEVTALTHSNASLEGCRTVQGRLSEVGKYAGEVAAADGVIHLASTMSSDRNVAIREDILGTGALLDGWRRGNFVYLSTQTVYGIPRGDLTEAHPLSPMCWYDIAKVCCEEQLAIEEPRPGRGEAVSLRIPPVFGPPNKPRGIQFLENIHAHCVRGHIFAFDSEEALETAGTSFIGPEDLARALADSLELKNGGGYNVSSGFCTWRELISEMGRRGGVAPELSLLSRLSPGAHYVRMPGSKTFVDSSSFCRQAGFSPSQNLESLIGSFFESAKVPLC